MCSGLYTVALTHNTHTHLHYVILHRRYCAEALQEAGVPGADAREIIRYAHGSTVMPGSSTVCLALMKPSGRLQVRSHTFLDVTTCSWICQQKYARRCAAPQYAWSNAWLKGQMFVMPMNILSR